MPLVTTLPESAGTGGSVDQIQAALQLVVGSITQIRVHERLLAAAGVRLDRAGSALLYKLHIHGPSLRVTELAELLGVDTPTVTRKIQQLEREHLVSRHADPDDKRAARIMLTREGTRTLERVIKARRHWFEQLLGEWDEAELAEFAALLTKFSLSITKDMDEARVN